MNVLVVGASGFIGCHVVRALKAAGHFVLGTSRDGSSGSLAYRLGDPFPAAVEEAELEAVVDLAWDGIPDFGSAQCAANVMAQKDFLEQVAHLGVRRLVIAGTCREYGNAVGVASGEARPVDDFGRAKNEVHGIAETNCRDAGVGLTWLRIFYAYGSGQRSGSLLPMVLEDLLAGREPRVRDRTALHDFVDVGDVAAAFVESLGSGRDHDVLDVGSGRSIDVGTVVEVARRIVAGDDSSAETYGRELDQSDQTICADVDRTKRLIGWRPTVDIEAGIRRMAGEWGLGDARLSGADRRKSGASG